MLFGLFDDDIALAADSRAIVGHSYAPNDCKIATIDNKLIITSSGMNGRVLTGGHLDYSTFTIAAEVAARFSAREVAFNTFGSRFAEAWAVSFGEALQHDMDSHPNEATDSANGVIVGLSDKGVLGYWFVRWRRVIASDRKTVQHTVTRKDWPGLVLLGEGAIADEAINGSTARGKKWKLDIQAHADKLPADQRNAFFARQFVDLSIRNLPPGTIEGYKVQDVGGPIDSITMDRNGRIKWGEHKPECK